MTPEMARLHYELLRLTWAVVGLAALAILSPHLGKMTKLITPFFTAIFNGKAEVVESTDAKEKTDNP